MDGTMRVSVVATGIDATDNTHDIPVPRRSLAEPLKPAQQVQDETPVEAETPAPAVARSAEEQPSMFNDLDAQRAAAEDQMEDIFEEAPAEQAQDDVPPPAYSPRVEQLDPVDRAEADVDDDSQLDAFVAPKAPAPGTPSPEAMARLQHAVSNAPGQRPSEAPQQPQARPQQPQPQAQQPQPQAQQPNEDQPHEKSRFGINSLINRMTGHSHEAESTSRPARQQPTMQAPQPQQTAQEEEDEQIEIPAFLRRQAN
jgi:cell division protein FtsZ